VEKNRHSLRKNRQNGSGANEKLLARLAACVFDPDSEAKAGRGTREEALQEINNPSQAQ